MTSFGILDQNNIVFEQIIQSHDLFLMWTVMCSYQKKILTSKCIHFLKCILEIWLRFWFPFRIFI